MKKYIKLDAKGFLCSVILAGLSGLGVVASSYYRSIVFNHFLENSRLVWREAGLLLLLIALTQVINFILTLQNAKLTEVWMLYLGNKISKNISEMGYKNFHQIEYGEYISWYTSDLERMEQTYFKPFLSVSKDVILSIISLTALFLIKVELGVLSIVLLLVLGVVGSRFGKKIGQAFQEFSNRNGHFTNVLQEYLGAYDMLKNFDRLKLLQEQINSSQKKLEKQRLVSKFFMACATLSFNGTQVLFEGLMFVFSLYLVSQGKLSIGLLLTTPTLLAIFLNSTSMILEQIVQMSGMASIVDKLNTELSIEQFEYPTIDCLELNNADFSYGDKTILNQFNRTFRKNKKYGLIGASGSGKSTILNIITGRLELTKGEFTMNGQKFDYSKDSVFANQIAYVNQSGKVLNLSIRDNITLGLSIDDDKIYETLKQVCLYDRIMDLPEKLDTVLGLDGNLLSGGERQRLILARALLRETPILILDEATSAIDKETAVLIEQRILDMADKMVIMISHHLDDTVRHKLDEIIVL